VADSRGVAVTTAGRPCSPIAAVTVARSLIGHMTYWLGTGDCDTPKDGRSDCFGFAFCRCYGVKRHRPGFNRGWLDDNGRSPSIIDDLNCNSAIEDADHRRELFVRAPRPELGDLLAYPTIHLLGQPKSWVGHIAIVIGVTRALEWDAAAPDWSMLDVAQCSGPDGRTPGVTATTGAHWNEHDRMWPKPEHRSALLRVVP
jgi:hypothetical protein